jgi:hypothetical protein
MPRFLYALRRDRLWNYTDNGYVGMGISKFLYALRRDRLWNPIPPAGAVTSGVARCLHGSLLKDRLGLVGKEVCVSLRWSVACTGDGIRA